VNLRSVLATVCLLGLAVAGLLWMALVGASYVVAFPEALTQPVAESVRVLDREGHLLARVRRDGELSEALVLAEAAPHTSEVMLAAEDARFFQHPGIDALAIGRAVLQAVRAGRVVSGASTLTQQLARATFVRKRTLFGKLHEMALALAIERRWSKSQILEAYLNRIEFGPNLRGLQAAARYYFAKPAHALSLSELATLAAIPRGPTLYDLKRAASPARQRRDRILQRLAERHPELAAQAAQAMQLPIELQPTLTWPGAHHWVRRLGADLRRAAEVHTTLDSALQRRVEAITRDHALATNALGASASAVLVVDHRSREVLAYVGSPDYFNREKLGQNDGVSALRQPGSTLKPFVYAAAMAQLGFTAATLLPDVPLELREGDQVYAPRNYDGRFHGPVRLRDALANSWNVPAVYTASRLGPAKLLTALHAFGFASLEGSPEQYGAALALGDGEVTLEELANAYATLASGGRFAPLQFRAPPAEAVGQPATTPAIAAVLLDILSDPVARSHAFGRNNALEFAFPVAVKTGTSKGARDNWTVGSSSEVTVAVWVGNFDGKPMPGASGVSGAGPLFHAVMQEAMRGRTASSVARCAALGLSRVQVCAESGRLADDACAVQIAEWFVPGSEPRPGDPDARDSAAFRSWAFNAERGAAPPQATEAARITFPAEGAQFVIRAGHSRAAQQLVLEAHASGATPIALRLNGVVLGPVANRLRVPWTMKPGAHQLEVIANDRVLDRVTFRVRE
jgi:penicillin-binding protein 1C